MNKNFTFIFFIIINLQAFSQTADFSWESSNGLYCTPSTIRFTQTATGSPTGYVWTFGNNQGSNSANPTTTFTTSGSFTVRLIVIYKKSTITVTKTININPAVSAAFESNRDEICMPGTIQFSAASEGLSNYEWNFGDNSGTVSGTSSSVNHFFSDYGTNTVSLKVTSAAGCFKQSFTTVTVKRPVVNATVSKDSGCVPAVINFNATVGLPPATSVTSYTWRFGDGNIQTTATPNATHSYLSAGTYTANLHVVTNEGCSNDFIFNPVAFGIPPTNHIAYPKKTIFCGSESPEFVSKATSANRYFWDFGEGDTIFVADTVMRHKFKTLGTKNITVTPLYNYCPGSPISFSVNVIGVIAGYKYANTCANKKQFSFTDATQGNQSSITWDFGDGTSISHDTNVVHTYPDTGTFATKLAITDNITGCIDTVTNNIYTAFPLLFNPDSSICKNSNTSFTIPDNYNNPGALYDWFVTGLHSGPNATPALTINATVLGHFNSNYVIIDNGLQYCPDTIRLKNNILVRGPQLAFTAPAEICLSKPYTVLNSSKPFIPTDIINQWHWDYGIPGQADSVFQPAPYFYPYWGMPFNVKLTAVDINGCMDTLVKPVYVYDIPFLRTIPDVDTLCAGQSATLIAFHNDDITWFPANGLSCVTCDTVIANPSVTTTYYIKATSRFNCSVTDSIMITVFTPFNAVTTKPQNYICAGEMIQLDVKPGMKKVRWYPATGLSDSTVFNPVCLPQHSMTYTATLTDSAGCFSSNAVVNVHVKSLPTVDAGNNQTYPFNTQYQLIPAYSSNVRSYAWEPSDLLTCNNCAFPYGVASKSQSYLIKVTSDSGCVATDEIAIFVECKYANLLLPTAFTPNRDQLNDYFYPISRGIKKITHFSIYSREGILVFDARDMLLNNPASGWNGTYKGMPQSASSYVYSLEAICETGETIYKKGSFVLLR